MACCSVISPQQAIFVQEFVTPARKHGLLSVCGIDVPLPAVLRVRLNLLPLHPQLLHESHRFHPVNGLGKDLFCPQGVKCILNHSLTGLKGVALPPKLPIKKPAQLVLSRLDLAKQAVPQSPQSAAVCRPLARKNSLASRFPPHFVVFHCTKAPLFPQGHPPGFSSTS